MTGVQTCALPISYYLFKIGQIPNLKQIVWANNDTMLAIDENGDRWGWGDNGYGELGNRTYNKIVSSLTKID